MTADEIVSAFNGRQTFNQRGLLYLICSLTNGTFQIFRVAEADPERAIAVSDPMADATEAVAIADNMRRQSLI